MIGNIIYYFTVRLENWTQYTVDIFIHYSSAHVHFSGEVSTYSAFSLLNNIIKAARLISSLPHESLIRAVKLSRKIAFSNGRVHRKTFIYIPEYEISSHSMRVLSLLGKR
jgi:hypothetical protein